MATANQTAGIVGVIINQAGSFAYTDLERGCQASANFPLFLIKVAWEAGCDFEDLADGFGRGHGTMGGDWSGIRDSSDSATAVMLQRAINYIKAKLG